MMTDKKTDLISIVVAMYNCKKYVNGFLDNLLNQDYNNIEIICVVEQSDDNTYQLVKEYAKDNNKIIIIEQKHLGPATARKNGLINSKGKYIVFLDVDDIFNHDYISKMHNVIKKDDSNIAICKCLIEHYVDGVCEYIGEGGYKIKKNINQKNINLIDYPFLLKDIDTYLHNKIFNKEFLINNNISFSNTSVLNDVLFCCSSLIKANKLSFIDECLYTYRKNHNTNSITSHKEEHKEDLITVYDELYKWLNTNGYWDLFKQYYFIKWKRSSLDFYTYGFDLNDANMICNYLVSCNPFCELTPDDLYRKCGFDTSLKKLKLSYLKLSSKEKSSYIKLTNLINSIETIKTKLQNDYGYNFNIKDNIFSCLYSKYTD